MLLYGDVSFLPDDLAPYTEIVEVDYPTRREIIRLVDEMTRENRARLELELDLQDIAPDLAGFGLYEIKRLVNRLLWLDPVDGRPLIFNPEARHRTILEAKRQTLLRSGGLLELEKSEGVRLGGMQEFRRWVDRNRERMTAPGRLPARAGRHAAEGRAAVRRARLRQVRGRPRTVLGVEQGQAARACPW